jgi:RHS repeat-associated protein
VQDDFEGSIDKWTAAQGGGFAIQNGKLVAGSSGVNLLVQASPKLFTDGMINVDVMNESSALADATILVRYQDDMHFYFVQPYNDSLFIFEFREGNSFKEASGSLGGSIVPQTWYHLQVTVEGSTLQAYWNGQLVTQWTDTNDPWLSGKIGFQQAYSRHVQWDNITVTTGGPGQVVSAQAYDPWGLVLDDMSLESGDPDSRYKFTGKERDIESQYDYFGARYYDSRIGRFLSVDRYAQKYLSLSPFSYAACNPVLFIDVNGDSIWISYGDGNRCYFMNGRAYNADGSEYAGDDSFVKAVMGALNTLSEGEFGAQLVGGLASHSNNLTIQAGQKAHFSLVGKTALIDFNPERNTGGLDVNGSTSVAPFVGLGHELGHAQDAWRGSLNTNLWYTAASGAPVLEAEKYSTHVENLIRAEHGLALRAYYSHTEPALRGEGSGALLYGGNVSRYMNMQVQVRGIGKIPGIRVILPFVYR